MFLFRLAWVTSCLGLSLASSQSLLRFSDYRSTAGLAKRFVPFDFYEERRESFAWNISLASQTKSANSQGAPSSLIASAVRPGRKVTTQTEQFISMPDRACKSTTKDPEIVPEILSTFSVEIAQEQSANLSLPQKIAQIFKGLFEWSELLSSQAEAESSGYVVTVTSRVNQQPSQTTLIKQGAQWLNSSATERVPFQVWVNGREIAQFSQQHQADVVAQSLQNALSKPDFEPLKLKPALIDEKPSIVMGDRLLFVVDRSLVAEQTINRELLAINWTNNLRAALDTPLLDLAEAQQEMYGLVETRSQFQGLASWYGGYFHGRMTANGEIFNQHAFTAAHPSLPFDTYLKVTNLKTDESAIVRINDRGPYIAPRTLDLSRGVAQCIKSEQLGVVPYNATIMKQSIPVDNI